MNHLMDQALKIFEGNELLPAFSDSCLQVAHGNGTSSLSINKILRPSNEEQEAMRTERKSKGEHQSYLGTH